MIPTTQNTYLIPIERNGIGTSVSARNNATIDIHSVNSFNDDMMGKGKSHCNKLILFLCNILKRIKMLTRNLNPNLS